MVLYHNIDESFKIHKVIVTKLSEAIMKLQKLGEEYGLRPILFYLSPNFPPLYYNFIDEDNDFTPCFSYIIPDTDLIKGNAISQINSDNYEMKLSSVEGIERNPDFKENFELYLKSGEEIKKFDGFQSRLDAAVKVLKIFKKKIEEGRVLQYFYHSYHTPPNSFLLLTEEGKPTGTFAFIHRVKDIEFKDDSIAKATLCPDLVKFTTDGELL